MNKTFRFLYALCACVSRCAVHILIQTYEVCCSFFFLLISVNSLSSPSPASLFLFCVCSCAFFSFNCIKIWRGEQMVREKKERERDGETTMEGQKMKSTREPEPNKTKEITFYGYSMKAPLNDTPSATMANGKQNDRIRGETWTVLNVCTLCTERKEKSLREMRLTKWSMEWVSEIRP